MKLFFQSKKSGKKYLVLSVSEDKTKVRLKGEFGEFEEPYDKDRFKALGYELVKEKDENDNG